MASLLPNLLAAMTLLQAERVEAIARDLDAADPRKAWAAVPALRALGTDALSSIEARARKSTGRAREALEIAAEEIRLSPLLTPVRRVTLQSSDRNPIDLLGDLRDRTGLFLPLENVQTDAKLPEAAVDLRDVPVVEALDAVCRLGNVGLQMEGGRFALSPGAYVEMPRFAYDGFLFSLPRYSYRKSVTFRKKAEEAVTIDLGWLWDPAATPCRFLPVRLTEATDDRGRNLLPQAAPQVAPANPDDPVVADAVAPGEGSGQVLELRPLSAEARKITVLRGVLPIGVPRRSVVLRLPAPKEGSKAEAAGFSVQFLSFDADKRCVELEATSTTRLPADLARLPVGAAVTLKGGERPLTTVSLDAQEGSLRVRVGLEAPRGRAVLLRPGEADREPPPLSIERVEVTVVTESAERRIPFEFRDVKIR